MRTDGDHDDLVEIGAIPAPLGQNRMHIAQRNQACRKNFRGRGIEAGISKSLIGDRLHQRQRILYPVLQLLDQEIALRLRMATVRDIAKHHADAVTERKQPVSQPMPPENHRLGFGADGFAALHRRQEELTQAGFARARKHLPQIAAKHLFGRAAKMSCGLVVEQDDAPIAIDGVKAFPNAI